MEMAHLDRGIVHYDIHVTIFQACLPLRPVARESCYYSSILVELQSINARESRRICRHCVLKNTSLPLSLPRFA